MKSDIFIKKTRINAPVEAVFSWHERNGAIARLTPPWAPLKFVSRCGEGIQKGVKVTFRIQIFKITRLWVAEHIE